MLSLSLSNCLNYVETFLKGERLEDKEVDDIMTACCDPEDDDGMIPYKRT